MQIRPLEAKADLALVLQFYRDAPDYWQRECFEATGVCSSVGSSNPRDEVHRLVKAL